MIKFCTGGWRAIIGDEFTKANIQKLTQAVANLMKSNETTIGYDRRFLSDLGAQWAAEVFAAIILKYTNPASPTPMTMFTVQQKELENGLAITASHNPALYNGIKVFKEGGQDIDSSVIQQIEGELENISEETIYTKPFHLALEEGLIEYYNPQNDYIDFLLEKIDQRKIRDAELNIAIDPMFGVSKTSLSMISTVYDVKSTLFTIAMTLYLAVNCHHVANLQELSDIVKAEKLTLVSPQMAMPTVLALSMKR